LDATVQLTEGKSCQHRIFYWPRDASVQRWDNVCWLSIIFENILYLAEHRNTGEGYKGLSEQTVSD